MINPADIHDGEPTEPYLFTALVINSRGRTRCKFVYTVMSIYDLFGHSL